MVWPDVTKVTTNSDGETLAVSTRVGRTTATIGFGAINAFAVQLRYKAADIPSTVSGASGMITPKFADNI
jgi:hypothetical protein